jgi:hypothetical protein
MRGIYDEVVDKITQLARRQVNEVQRAASGPGWTRLSAIFIVGGFGRCRYLQKRLKEDPELQHIPFLITPNG